MEESDNTDSIAIKVILNPDLCNIKEIYITVSNGKVLISKTHTKYKYIFEPRTHMRDFEVIERVWRRKTKTYVARGQGIGVIIIRPLSTYIKIIYNKHKDKIPKITDYRFFNPNIEKDKKAVEHDLIIGYEIMFIEKDADPIFFCESIDKGDSQETPILFEYFRPLAKFQPIS